MHCFLGGGGGGGGGGGDDDDDDGGGGGGGKFALIYNVYSRHVNNIKLVYLLYNYNIIKISSSKICILVTNHIYIK